jgi:magnesium and cobalt transporter
MTDTDDTDEKSRSRGGLFSRLRSALSGKEEPDSQIDPEERLRLLRVEDVMIPTAEVVSVPDTITRDELVHVFRDSGLTRLPVFRDTLDHPLGFVHLKDFALTCGFTNQDRPMDLAALIRPLLFVPPSMRAANLLQRMQKERSHIALVIDEYGAVDGLVTLEDLIEELVGEIEDEHDEEEDALWHEEKPGVWMAQAIAELDDLSEAIGVPLRTPPDEEDVETLGGLVAMMAGRVPVKGEVITSPDGLVFEVIDADRRQIKRLRIRLPEPVASA